MNTKEIAKEMNVTPLTIRRWIKAGCPAWRRCRAHYELDLEQVQEWLQNEGTTKQAVTSEHGGES